MIAPSQDTRITLDCKVNCQENRQTPEHETRHLRQNRFVQKYHDSLKYPLWYCVGGQYWGNFVEIVASISATRHSPLVTHHSTMVRNTLLSLILCQFLTASGCLCLRDNTPGLSNVTPEANPMFVASNDHDFVWDRIVDAVDDYFDIEREDPIRPYGNLISEVTEGRIDTRPRIAATYLEPWFQDSVTHEELRESTCQTIRRRAMVRVVPQNNGFLIFVSVYKELEDLQRPLGANAGAASFTHVNFINTITNIGNDAPTSYGWIPMGRDAALEQRILLKIRHNISNPPMTIH